jgi:hypothetical protein
MSTETNDNVVPELGVASIGAPRLDADPVDPSFMDEFDKLDDAALQSESGVVETPTAEPAVETPTEDENFLNDGLNPVEPVAGVEEPVAPTEPAAESTPAEPVAEPTPAEIVPGQADSTIDPEIAAIEQPRNMSEQSQNNWKKLRETASRYKQEAAEAEMLRNRIAELEKNPTQAPPDYEDLKKFKQIFDLKNDPEFHTKYEAPIKGATDNIYSILKKNGASDETIESIQKLGGPDKVSQDWWKQNVIDKLPLTDAEKLKRNLVDVVDLKEKQEQEIITTAQHAEQILEERKNEKIRWFQNETQAINNEVEQITKEVAWARYQPIPENATPEQVQQIQNHNTSVQDLAAKFNQALWPQSASERTRVAAAAVLSHKLTEQLRLEQQMRSGMETKLKKLELENSQLKQVGRAPKPSANSTQTKVTPGSNDRWKLNAGDAIDMGLDEAGA